MPEFTACVCPIVCPHCKQQQEVHIHAVRGGMFAAPDQMFHCANTECGKTFFDLNVPPICGGPYLQGKGPAPGIVME
jgi:transposase-like protein